MKNGFERLRPAPYIIFVAKIWAGCKMYQVCTNDVEGSRFFHTKKEAEKFIRERFSGDEMRIRLFDLKRCRPSFA